LIPVTGRLELRCIFGAPWKIDQAVSGVREIPYHVLLSGHAVLEDINGPPGRLTAGDIILFPAGNAHLIHDGSGKPAGLEIQRPKASLIVLENDGPGDKADFMCGRFLLGAIPDRLLRDHLPGRLVVHSALPEQGADVEGSARSIARTRRKRLIELIYEEANEPGPGSEMFVNLSAALFALTLRFAMEGTELPHGLLALAQGFLTELNGQPFGHCRAGGSGRADGRVDRHLDDPARQGIQLSGSAAVRETGRGRCGE
jgi:AraC family transcriptional activator of mtrCDE